MPSDNTIVTSSKASVVDTFHLKPYWVGKVTPYLLKNELSSENINFSRILHNTNQELAIVSQVTFIIRLTNWYYFRNF